MFNFTGSKCPYCGEVFKEGDDIAVCPECGTPHHRACYKTHGHCANEALHAEGFVWAPDLGAAETAPEAGQPCPACGYVNDDGATRCASCGRPLAGSATELSAGKSALSPLISVSSVSPPSQAGDAFERALWPYNADDVRADDLIDGFTVREWASYIARNAGYYIYCFKTQDKAHRKMAFTWSAMMFAPIYFLYRRVWWAAAAAWFLNLTLGFPTLITGFAESGSFLGLTLAQWQNIEPLTSTILLAINVLWGIFAAWIYRKNSARTLGRLHAEHTDEASFRSAFAKASGPSLAAAIAIPVAVALAVSLLLITLFPDFAAAFSSLPLY